MSLIFNIAKGKLMDGTLDLDTNTIKVALVTNATAVPADATLADADTMAAVLTGGVVEASGTGYQNLAGGGGGRKALATKSVVVDDSGNRATFKADDVTWDDGPGISAGTLQGALVYQHNHASDDTQNIPIAWVNTGGISGLVTNGGSLKIKWAENAAGNGVVIVLT